MSDRGRGRFRFQRRERPSKGNGGAGGAAGRGPWRGSGPDARADYKRIVRELEASERNPAQGLSAKALEEALDRANKFSMPHPRISSEEFGTLLGAFSKTVDPGMDYLGNKLCRFATAFVVRHKHPSLRRWQLDAAFAFLLAYLGTCAAWFRTDALRTLATMLREFGDRVSGFQDGICAALEPSVGPAAVDAGAAHQALTAVSNYVHRAGAPVAKAMAPSIAPQCLAVLRTHAPAVSRGADSVRVVTAACRALGAFYDASPSALGHAAPEVARICTTLLPFGCEGALDAASASNSSAARPLQPACLARWPSRENHSAAAGAASAAETDTTAGSGEEVSEGAFGSEQPQLYAHAARLRAAAATLLGCIFSHLKKEVRSHWMALCVGPRRVRGLPRSAGTAPLSLSARADPSPRVRVASFLALAAALDGAPLWTWFRAQGCGAGAKQPAPPGRSPPHSAAATRFTAESSLAEPALRLLHADVVHALQADPSCSVVTAALRAHPVLSTRAPAELLEQCAAAQTLPALHALARHGPAEGGLRAAAVHATCALLREPGRLPSLAALLQGQAEHSAPTLAQWAAATPTDASALLPQRVDALSVLGAAAAHYMDAVWAHWDKVEEALKACVTHRDEALRQAVHRLCAALCDGQPQAAGDTALLEAVASAVAATGQRGLEDPSARVRAAACGALAPLTAHHWATEAGRDALPPVCAALIGAGRDSVPTVRAAAQRALGSLCTASPTHTPTILGPLISAVAEAAADTHLGTRSNAVWALANAAHALSRARCTGPDGSRLADGGRVKRAAEAALAGMGDQPKVATSAVRACAYLAAYAAAEGDTQGVGEGEDGLDGLAGTLVGALAQQVEAGSQPKATWNACVGLGLALSAADAARGAVPAWVGPCVAALTQAITRAENYKVRVNAATALCAPEHAAHWAQPLRQVAGALATAYGAAEAEEARSALDVKYLQQLRSMLVKGMAHVADVAGTEDGQGSAVAEAVAEVAPALAAALVSATHGMGEGEDGADAGEEAAGVWMLGERPLLPPTRPFVGARGRARAAALARLLLSCLESGAVDAETQSALARLAASRHAAAVGSPAQGEGEDEDEDEL